MITRQVWMDLRALARQGDPFARMGEPVGLERRAVKTPLPRAQPPVYQCSPGPPHRLPGAR